MRHAQTHKWIPRLSAAILGVTVAVVPAWGQTAGGMRPAAPAVGSAAGSPPAAAGTAPAAAAAASPPPADYLIGADDVLSIVFWRDKDMTTDVIVRPDGKISLPVLNEIAAAGLTPEQLRASILTVATKFFEDPSVNVVVKQINSRKVSITGEVAKPGQYPLGPQMNVLQLIAAAGGLAEYAKKDNIVVIRADGAKQTRYRFNYDDVIDGKNLRQNIDLKVGDVVLVP